MTDNSQRTKHWPSFTSRLLPLY